MLLIAVQHLVQSDYLSKFCFTSLFIFLPSESLIYDVFVGIFATMYAVFAT